MRQRYKSFQIYHEDMGCGQKAEVTLQITVKGVPYVYYRQRSLMERNFNDIYFKRVRSDGICFFCGEIDPIVLEEHHIDKEKMPFFTITLCANCHRKIHWYLGRQQYGKSRNREH